MTKPTQYFSTLNLSVLPQKASNFISSELLTDADIDLLDADDEDFLAVKNLIKESYPDALPKETKTTTDSPEKAKALAELVTINELMEITDGDDLAKLTKEKQDIEEILEFL